MDTRFAIVQVSLYAESAGEKANGTKLDVEEPVYPQGSAATINVRGLSKDFATQQNTNRAARIIGKDYL